MIKISIKKDKNNQVSLSKFLSEIENIDLLTEKDIKEVIAEIKDKLKK